MARSQSQKLELYRWAVQHPESEVHFLLRCYQHYRRKTPTRLKEDFAGTAAVAAHWAAWHENMRAMAVESHGPTLRWALRKTHGIEDLHLVEADVTQVKRPQVDIVVALNFSTFVYHDRRRLCAYFRAARRSLRPGGMLVIDAYGGPGAMTVGKQRRKVKVPGDETIRSFVYCWEQRSFDAVTARVDCRIHFTLPDRTHIRNAFRYDWRLWSLPELIELMHDAGFSKADVWCDVVNKSSRRIDAEFRPVKHMPARHDWVAYVVGL